jgi:hypothetical protein
VGAGAGVRARMDVNVGAGSVVGSYFTESSRILILTTGKPAVKSWNKYNTGPDKLSCKQSKLETGYSKKSRYVDFCGEGHVCDLRALHDLEANTDLQFGDNLQSEYNEEILRRQRY